MRKPGDSIGRCLLKEKIGELGFYIKTWRATDERGVEVVLKLHHSIVSSEYDPATNNLSDKVAGMVPRLDCLVAMPPHPGIAPWTQCEFNPEQDYLLLRRLYYRDSLGDQVPIPYTPQYIGILDEIAKGIDFLQNQRVGHAAMFPGNLLTDGSHGYFADFGLEELHHLIETGYDGPRPGGTKLKFFFDQLAGLRGDEEIVAKFGALYFYLRTGKFVFGSFAWGPDSASHRVFHAMKEYRETGRLCLDALPNLREREAVARALTTDKSQRFASCSEFMTTIAP